MHPLTAAGILRASERGHNARPFERALHLLAAAEPADTWHALCHLPIGARDAHLLALRQASLGSRMRAYVRCPMCGSELTFDLEATELAASASPPEGAAEVHEITAAGVTAWFRLPSSVDFDDLPASLDATSLRRLLAERCLVAITRDGVQIAGESMPDELVDAISESMSRLDPGADTTINLACPDCAHQWPALFDIATFLWEETAMLARRLLVEVDALAHRYGWREADILSMTAWRREAYLDLVSE
jgi:hypothetical protein